MAREQILKRIIKSRGGLTRGRDFTEYVHILGVYSMPKCASIHQAKRGTGLQQTTRKQHVDMVKAKMQRDSKDMCTMMSWLKPYNSFDNSNDTLRSISAGLTATPESGINCDDAGNVEVTIQMRMDNSMISDLSIKRNDQVKNLAKMESKLAMKRFTSTQMFYFQDWRSKLKSQII